MNKDTGQPNKKEMGTKTTFGATKLKTCCSISIVAIMHAGAPKNEAVKPKWPSGIAVGVCVCEDIYLNAIKQKCTFLLGSRQVEKVKNEIRIQGHCMYFLGSWG